MGLKKSISRIRNKPCVAGDFTYKPEMDSKNTLTQKNNFFDHTKCWSFLGFETKTLNAIKSDVVTA